MVEQSQLDQLQRLLQASGDSAVGGARRRVSRRVVVADDDSGGVVAQRSTDDFAGMDFSPVNGAPEHRLHGDDAVAGVEEDHVEFFVVEVCQAHPQEVAGVIGPVDLALAIKPLAQDGLGLTEDGILAEVVAPEIVDMLLAHLASP